MDKKRIIWIEILRIIACFSVVGLHVSSYCWKDCLDLVDEQLLSGAIFSRLFNWAVPVFVMITGAGFLNQSKEISFDGMKKYIFRIAFLLFSWNLIYSLYGVTFCDFGLKDFLFTMVMGWSHMWYMYMLMLLYIFMPLFKQLVAKKQITIFLAFFWISYNWLNVFISLAREASTLLESCIVTLIERFSLRFFVGYEGLLILGYWIASDIYIRNINKNKLTKFLWHCSGIIVFTLNIWFGIEKTRIAGEISLENRFDWWGVYLFIVVKECLEKRTQSEVTRKIIMRISQSTLGIYLIHMLIIELLMRFGITCDFANPFFSIPVLTIGVFTTSMIITFLLKKCALLRRLVV